MIAAQGGIFGWVAPSTAVLEALTSASSASQSSALQSSALQSSALHTS
jgi:hypothetical protein